MKAHALILRCNDDWKGCCHMCQEVFSRRNMLAMHGFFTNQVLMSIAQCLKCLFSWFRWYCMEKLQSLIRWRGRNSQWLRSEVARHLSYPWRSFQSDDDPIELRRFTTFTSYKGPVMPPIKGPRARTPGRHEEITPWGSWWVMMQRGKEKTSEASWLLQKVYCDQLYCHRDNNDLGTSGSVGYKGRRIPGRRGNRLMLAVQSGRNIFGVIAL